MALPFKEFYRPDNWMPHVTLRPKVVAAGLDVVKCLHQVGTPFNAQVERWTVISLPAPGEILRLEGALAAG